MAEPAPPILGSALLSAALSRPTQRLHPASTGCLSLDKALQGGLRYGEITSVAGGSGMGKSLIALHAAASHLIAHTKGEVAFIDTTGSFSPLRLRDVFLRRLTRDLTQARYKESGYVYEKVKDSAEPESGGALQDQATAMLDRVSIMRVFDFPGVIEAVAEISEHYERSKGAQEIKGHEVRDQGTEELSEDHDDASSKISLNQSESMPMRPAGMIIIDNIANVISSMMTKNQTYGQALMTTSLRSLHTLTQSHNICTILINSAVALGNPPNVSYAPAYSPPENASIFSSTRGKPALGQMYSYLIDTSIFISSVPKTSKDAATAYGGAESGPRNYNTAKILEVLKDRYGNREGDWGAFDIIDGIELDGFG